MLHRVQSKYPTSNLKTIVLRFVAGGRLQTDRQRDRRAGIISIEGAVM
jgi:hypothetical protein